MRKKENARFSGVGNTRGTGGPGADKSVNAFVNPIVPQSPKNCQQDLDTTSGGPVAWAIKDALHTFKCELIARNLIGDTPEIDAALMAAWLSMCEASYAAAADLEGLGEVAT